MKKKKNLEKRAGYKNRHIDGLPTGPTGIKIIIKDIDGEREHLCQWQPYDPETHKDRQHQKPSKGFLGAARTIDRDVNTGYAAWEFDDSEFIYYKHINHKPT